MKPLFSKWKLVKHLSMQLWDQLKGIFLTFNMILD